MENETIKVGDVFDWLDEIVVINSIINRTFVVITRCQTFGTFHRELVDISRLKYFISQMSKIKV